MYSSNTKKKLSKSDIYVTIHKEFLLGNRKAVHFTRDYSVHIIVALGRCIARQWPVGCKHWGQPMVKYTVFLTIESCAVTGQKRGCSLTLRNITAGWVLLSWILPFEFCNYDIHILKNLLECEILLCRKTTSHYFLMVRVHHYHLFCLPLCMQSVVFLELY